MADHPFPYLAEVAARYGKDELQVVREQAGIIRSLTKKDLASLASVYTEIERREDSYRLSRWIDEAKKGGLKRAARQASMLLILYKRLGEQGVEPFAGRAVRYMDKLVRLDWTKLPGDLVYLAEPAEKYGKYQFFEQVQALWDRITVDEYETLRELNARALRDSDKINRFIQKYNMTQHKEAALVYFLIGVLDSFF